MPTERAARRTITWRAYVGIGVVGALLFGVMLGAEPLSSSAPFENVRFHGVLETFGALAAIATAVLLLHRGPGEAQRIGPVAAGLVGMGTLDLFHALSPTGNGFVALRTAAALCGAVGFAASWVPLRARGSPAVWSRWIPIAVGVLTAAIGTALLARPEAAPVMVREGRFTAPALVLNFVAGALFLAGAVRFFSDHRRSGRTERFLLGWIGVLCGLAGLMFNWSALWNEVWWASHALRIVAFVALGWLIIVDHRVIVAHLRSALEHRLEAERKLRALNADLDRRVSGRTAALAEAVRTRDELLALVSHDLRNPLSAIALGAWSLQRSIPSGATDRAIATAKTIARTAGVLNRLIGDLLDGATIDSGGLTIEAAPTDVAVCVREAVAMLQPLADEKRLQILQRVPVTVPPVTCDRGRILQVLSNLLGNAIKFTPAGAAISVALEDSGQELRCTIVDSGPGIAAEDLPRLYDRHWHARRAARGGAGLGLYISKALVEAHGGRIWATSRLGHGATFCFILPRAAGTERALASAGGALLAQSSRR